MRFLAVMRFPFLMRFPYEMSCYLAAMRCSCEIWYFLLHNYRTRYPDEMSCFLGPLRALRMRFHNACLAVMRFLDEITCFSFWWCDVRTVERWMLRNAGDWVYMMVYWRLRGFVCVSWVVRWRGKWSKFCGGGWCKCECVRRQKGLCGSSLDSCSQHALFGEAHAIVIGGFSRGLGLVVMMWCKDGEECGRLSVLPFCGCGWCKCECVGRQKGVVCK
jgi:hypothetical protein